MTFLAAEDAGPLFLNDVHSRLNGTRVAEVLRPTSTAEVIAAVQHATALGLSISISGARHSMGGQQWAEGSVHLDMRGMNRFIALDVPRRLARVEAGMTWTGLLDALEKQQPHDREFLTLTQKQTGADELTLGGAVSSNIHGRGLTWHPMVQDVESVTLINAKGAVLKVSRTEHADLFRLVVGGYGLFGVITEVELRLTPRIKLERVVEITSLNGIPARIEKRVADGFVLGDFQFCPDESSPQFLREGVFSCYRPAAPDGTLPASPLTLKPDAWRRLMLMAHTNKGQGWSDYTSYYRRTNGQIYWSDRSQFNYYDPDYEEHVEAAAPGLPKGSLMITELYVPRNRLEDFMAACAEDFRDHGVNVIYGTVRFIRRDDESFLAWARDDYACIVFNLRVTHSDEGLEKAGKDFRRLIDRALERGGSFYLTYHRWASLKQMLQAYPQFQEFLRLKKQYDPGERFQSEWYRHWVKLCAQGQ